MLGSTIFFALSLILLVLPALSWHSSEVHPTKPTYPPTSKGTPTLPYLVGDLSWHWCPSKVAVAPRGQRLPPACLQQSRPGLADSCVGDQPHTSSHLQLLWLGLTNDPARG